MPSAPDLQEQVAPAENQRESHDAGTRAELRRKTIRGAFLSCLCQGANFALRTGSMMVLARLLTPRDFGLFGMVAAITGFLGLFKEAGLSTAAVQSATVTEGQQSMLFWVNVLVGCVLALLCAASAPMVAAFYGEPKLSWIMLATAASFIFTGLAAQHRAVLMRELRFGTIAGIDVLSFAISIAVSIVMA